jgi:hypothetical protein
MTKLYVPHLGDKLELLSPWEFTLNIRESRNDSLAEALRIEWDWRNKDPAKTSQVILGKGVMLTVRRIYIRQGQKAFDSMTFSAKIPSITPKGRAGVLKPVRFFASLDDCNTMEFKVVE